MKARKAKQDLDKPRLTNLNEDPMLSGVVHHYMKADAKVTIGRKDADPKPDVALTGLGVQKNHAVITCEESVFKIEPGQSNAKVKVNGKPISSGIVSIQPTHSAYTFQLWSMDRVNFEKFQNFDF